MSIELSTVTVRAPRRLRLTFSNTLAAGAFGLAPVLYVVTPTDDFGVTATVKAALIVPGEATNVELALSEDLTEGATYRVTAIGVPAGDASLSTTASDTRFVVGKSFARQANAEDAIDNGEILLYGTDLVWNGTDFEETINGDLARVSGASNAVTAVTRRLFASGLPWDATYGADPRSYVDSPMSGSGTLRTVLLSQSVTDDRVKSATVDFIADENHPDQATFNISLTLVGDRKPEPISLTVNT